MEAKADPCHYVSTAERSGVQFNHMRMRLPSHDRLG